MPTCFFQDEPEYIKQARKAMAKTKREDRKSYRDSTFEKVARKEEKHD